jgi:hypothetical protein
VVTEGVCFNVLHLNEIKFELSNPVDRTDPSNTSNIARDMYKKLHILEKILI